MLRVNTSLGFLGCPYLRSVRHGAGCGSVRTDWVRPEWSCLKTNRTSDLYRKSKLNSKARFRLTHVTSSRIFTFRLLIPPSSGYVCLPVPVRGRDCRGGKKGPFFKLKTPTRVFGRPSVLPNRHSGTGGPRRQSYSVAFMSLVPTARRVVKFVKHLMGCGRNGMGMIDIWSLF